ncbi:septation protein A [Vibrio sp. UCD-FRSSP16_10]|uniref:septation protein A n=1 Tax=unclassified Vibrio TaxID=2614977 RepID=UPI00080228ED|nr:MULTISPECIES: septation protein A [unclassified Vibrio]OBT13858.1 septation protein A [Vibrio sp. UCD-FRSSP16_30]OBT22739.1 septation protein A [Vibrio sp. UCD-FRSSP16_10]
MKQLLDFIPLIIFFVLYKMYDIYVGTGALIAATALQLLITYFVYKKVGKMQLITFLVVVIFGSMTILLHDEDFIKWKVTLVYTLFSFGLIISQRLGKPAIKGMLEKEISLPDNVWKRINWAWSLFFAACALLNIYVAFHLSLDVWVNFKVFGLSIATLLFALLTGFYIYQHIPKESKK